MQLQNLNQPLAMTSLEIAELTGKNHAHVMRDIRKMLEDLEQNPNLDSAYKSTTYTSSTGQSYPLYELDKDLTLTLLTGYDASARYKVVKRWQALEADLSARQNARLEGKQVRRLEAENIAEFVEYAKGQGSKSPRMYYTNITRMTNKLLDIESGTRDTLDTTQLRLVSIVENIVGLALQAGIKAELPHKEVYQLAKMRANSVAETFKLI